MKSFHLIIAISLLFPSSAFILRATRFALRAHSAGNKDYVYRLDDKDDGKSSSSPNDDIDDIDDWLVNSRKKVDAGDIVDDSAFSSREESTPSSSSESRKGIPLVSADLQELTLGQFEMLRLSLSSQTEKTVGCIVLYLPR